MSIAMLAVACGPGPAEQHHATAQKVLERAGGPGTFVDASTVDAAALRHAPSGMVCTLPADGAFDLETFPASAANPGAYCSNARDGVATTLVAVRFGDATNLDTAFADAVASSAGPGAPFPWPGKASAADKSAPDGLPHFRIARLQTPVNGEPQYLRIAVSEARGWYLQQIVSAPLDVAEAVEAKAGQEWRNLLREFQKHPDA